MSNDLSAGMKSNVVSMDELIDIVAKLRTQGRRVVQCHGVFDLLHIGHIRHLESARESGDVLVVTVTRDEFVGRGPGHPTFPLKLRIETLAALACVDYVAPNPKPTAADSIRMLKPDVYARGPDYRLEQVDLGSSSDEAAAVRDVGGRFVVTNDISFSASSVASRQISLPSEETRAYLSAFAKRYPVETLTRLLDQAQELKVLVIGETIIDEYHYVETIGKSSKEPLLATREISKDVFAGGILAVANNIANFSKNVDLVTFLGTANGYDQFARSNLNATINPTFIPWQDAPTIVKRRYVESYAFTKLFEVYEMEDAPLPERESAELCSVLASRLASYDVVVVVDFGHGMMNSAVKDVVAQHARFLALNVQSNAGNHPYHTIGKYGRADFISCAENEVRLDARDRVGDLRSIIIQLSERLAAPKVVVTRGKYGCLCFGAGEGTVEVPSLASEVVDRVGAGDAFLSLSALVAALGAPMEVVGFMGSAASAQAVATVGHQRSVERGALVDHLSELLP
jgi:rfaE bifunctional protein nucleotidyltransferase chain/domain